MKRTIIVLLLTLVLMVSGGCWHFRDGSGATQDSVATGDTATRDTGTRDNATRDTATGDSHRGAAFTEVPEDYSAAELHPLDFRIDPAFFASPLKHNRAQLTTEELLQEPELPTGCESVAVTDALMTLGYHLEKTDFAEHYMTYGEDVMWDYVGDPTDYSGAGIFPPGLTNCTNRYLLTQHSQYVAYNTMGVEFRELFKLIDAGYPVVMWTTMDYELPLLDEVAYEYEDQYYFWYELEHCVMLCGYDLSENNVTINDPLQGVITVDLKQMEAVYNETGKLSMTIIKEDSGSKKTATVPPATVRK